MSFDPSMCTRGIETFSKVVDDQVENKKRKNDRLYFELGRTKSKSIPSEFVSIILVRIEDNLVRLKKSAEVRRPFVCFNINYAKGKNGSL